MTKKSTKTLTEQEQFLKEWINTDRIQSVANGYTSALQVIRNMLKSGKTKKELLKFCDTFLSNSDAVVSHNQQKKEALVNVSNSPSDVENILNTIDQNEESEIINE